MTPASAISASPVAASAVAAKALNFGLRRVAYIGDSTSCKGFIPRKYASGVFARSDAVGLPDGDGTWRIYSDLTTTWQAFGDTEGDPVACGDGLVWLESGSAGKGICVNVATDAAPDPGPRVVSITSTVTVATNALFGHGTDAPCAWAQVLSGQKLDVTQWGGIDGETTEGLLLRLPSVFGRDSFGKAANVFPDEVVIMIGTNDVFHIAAETEGFSMVATKANLVQIRDYILSRGSRPRFCTIAFEAPSATEWSLIQELNAYFVTLAAGDHRVNVTDFAGVITDPEADGAAYTNTMDGLHYTPFGSKLAGQVIADALVAAGNGYIGRSDFRVGAKDDNVSINGAFVGNDEAVSWAPPAPSGSAVQAAFTGSGTVVASKQSVAGENDWQIYTITGAAEDDQLDLLLGNQSIAGDIVYTNLEFDISGDGVRFLTTGLIHSDGDAQTEYVLSSAAASVYNNLGAYSGVMETRDIDVPSWAISNDFIVQIKFSAGDTVIRFRDGGGRRS